MSIFRRAYQAIARGDAGKAPREDGAGADPPGNLAAILGVPTVSYAASRALEIASAGHDRPFP